MKRNSNCYSSKIIFNLEERLWSDAKTLMQMLKTGHGKYHEVMIS
jgi:hypothetical protein